MTLISDLEVAVEDLLEETRGAPIFWSLPNELRVFIVDALNEATLITGYPVVRTSAPFTFPANQTLVQAPAGALAITRVEAPGQIKKDTLWQLDQMMPGWEALPKGPNISGWFPLGFGQFGIYPQLQASVNGFLTYVTTPVTSPRPYTGAETVPFPAEFMEGFKEHALCSARFKEGGKEFQQSLQNFNRFLDIMTELTAFTIRTGSLRFTRSMGARTGVTDVKQK